MDLKLSVLLNMIDKVTAPLRGITGSSTAASKALRETRQRLKELQKAQDDLKGFRQLKAGTQALAGQLTAAQKRATELGRAIASTTNPSRQQTREFAAAKRQAAALDVQYQTNVRRLQTMRENLSAAGISTKNLSAHERRLRDDIAATNTQMGAQQQKLSAITQQQQKMAAARQSFERGSATAAHLSVGGYAARETGRHVLDAISPTVAEAKAWAAQVAQLQAMGVGDAMVSDAQKFARGQDIMGTSATETLKLLKESYSVLRDMHEAEAVTPYLARMKFGIETVMAQGGHGDGHGDNAETMFMDLLKVAELRGAAKSPESLKRVLDFATQAYVASGGLVKSEDMLNMIKTGGVAAKQLDDQTFFFGLLHTMQEMGGHRAGTGLATAYQNWAAGRTTQQAAEELAELGLLNTNAVKYGKTGHVTKLLPDALKDGDLYRNNPLQYLLEKVVPKLNPDGKLNDQQVVSKINALFSGRKGGDLFSSLYLERANIAKHQAAAPKAYGVDALSNLAAQNAAGQEADLLARKSDLYRELGEQLLPLYVAGLGKLVGVLRAVNTWAQRHPMLAKGMLVVAGSAGVLLATVGSLMVGLGGLLGQFALLRYAMRMGGLKLGALAGGTEGGLLSRLPMLGRLFPTLATGARAAMVAITGISWPVLALVAVLVVAALTVRRYWQLISAWFSGVWEGIRQAAGPALADIGAALAPLKPAFDLVVDCLASVWRWFSQLLEPMQATKEQLDGARSAGVSFGRVVGAAIGGVAQVLTFGVQMFVALGEAIGTAAGWVAVHWEPVKAWFSDMWQSVENAARKTLDWISEKLGAVRDLIDRIRNFGSSPATQPGAVPIEWITGDDPEKARKIADAIARTPMAGGEATAPGTSLVNNAAPVGVRPPKTVVMQGDQVTMHVDARGNDPDSVKRQVADAMAQHERSKQVRARSAFSDED